ncbi:DUF4335 domain-containing protein [Phormidium sp. CLA17]|uniref:DUF4335 domain-containing protein n=1 Tax=Leptolyngbya sp. Cla-17 TaxID=2803751 RepID=UPI001492D606|nr:DUF4335 domain-containing protein [Leptolyngbya sp. Cla-17]MBM0742543.1 DUF4335 domain-containing protein [Leptolyngbya sp. Cla-17]
MTTIQRLYSLPNCSLMLEGFSDNLLLNSSEFRPLLSMLINTECRLARLEKPLSGGREFLESLVSVVSQYAQEFLSGLHATRLPKQSATGLVRLERVNDNTHRLSLRAPTILDSNTNIASSPTEIDLSTVELFDLVEAIDQLLADTQTLPDLSLNLKPLSRKEIAKTEPVTKQIVPAAIGLSSLAAAAFALSLLPVPKVEPPKDLYPVRSSATTTTPPISGSSPTPAPSQSTPSPSPSALSSSPSPATADLKKLEATLTAAPEISDPTTLDQIGKQLRGKIEQKWTTKSVLPQDLIYQVGVGNDGAILGYKAVNAAALDNAAKVPLLDLVARQGDRPTSDPLALFKVVFTPSGDLEVAPWNQVTTSPITGITEITESAKLEEILPKLRSQINQGWATAPNFNEDLIYKVRIREDGTVVDYSAENDAAARYAQETPLSKLGKLIANSNTAPVQEPLALYKVVFTPPEGAVEISPWRGWQN